MNDGIYELFCKCFPEFHIEYDVFVERLVYEENDVILFKKNEEEVKGFSIVYNNTILLLCVDPDIQGMGCGKTLLEASEKRIKENGYDTVTLGNGGTYIFPGVPVSNGKTASQFFEKQGYTYEKQSVDMARTLTDFDIDEVNLCSVSDNIQFQYYDKSNEDAVLEAVAKVEEGWVNYYKETESPVLLAVDGNTDQVLGFAIIDDNSYMTLDGYKKMGAVGCVGVVPEARQQGIGIWLVAYGMNDLKLNQCDGIFIGYTYYENWYAKLGCKTVTRYNMCMKKL